MCGILGLVHAHPPTPEQATDAIAKIARRGPDHSQNLQITEDTWFAHARLSIIDLSDNGNQPYQFEHLFITYNGMIYNYKELRDQRDAAINALLGSSQMVEYQAIIDTYKDQFNKLRQSRRDAIDNAVTQTRKILTPKQLELYDKMRPDRKDGWRKPHYDHKPDRRPDNHSPKGAPGEGPASEDQADAPEPPVADQD